MAAEWNIGKLNDLIECLIDYRGKTPQKTTEGVPLITAKIVKNGRILKPNEFIAKEYYESWMTRGLPQKGDIVLTSEAPLGEVAQLNDSNVALGQRIILLRGKKGILDNTFLKYYFLSSIGKGQLLARETGTTVTGIKQSELRQIDVNFPEYSNQQKIAKILSSLDEKIELNDKINENLHAQAQAIFKSWFADFEPFGGTMPSDWEEGKVCDIFDITIGKTPPRKELCWFSHKESDIRWLSISDMKNNDCYALTSSEYLTIEAIKKFNIKVVSDNTVLLSFKLTIGRVSITCGEMATNEAIAHFNTDDKKLVEYLYYYLRSYNYQSLGNTSSIATAVNSKIIKAIPFILPTREVLENFHSIIAPYFGKVKNNILENQKLVQIRDTLLPKLMSGELEV